jgi:nicotinate-nucleotide adenylyltransferase
LRLSLFALKRLALDEVWWLVSPQNPLKPATGMAPLNERLESAATMAAHPRIRATDIETELGTRYTIDTLNQLVPRHPDVRFVWLMGADNLAQVDRWYRWRDIFACVPVAVIDRPGKTYTALSSRAALALARHRYKGPLHGLSRQTPPAWAFIFGFRDGTSATALRQSRTHG